MTEALRWLINVVISQTNLTLNSLPGSDADDSPQRTSLTTVKVMK